MGIYRVARAALAALALVALSASSTFGDVLVSNLTEPERHYNDLNATDWAAQSFETDGREYTLTSITTMVGNDNGGGLFAELRSADISGRLDPSPSGLITTFIVPFNPGPRSPATFVPTTSVRLSPSTRYFFVVGCVGGGAVQWAYAEGNGQAGPGSLSVYEYTFDSGLTWPLVGSDNPFFLEVEVSSSEVIVSNLGELERSFNVLNATDWAAQSFETDASAWSLVSVSAIVGADTGSGMFAELRASDLNGLIDMSPSGLVTTFAPPFNPFPRSPQVFLPISPVTLAPSTRYFFLLGGTGGGQFEWSYAEGNASIGPGVLSLYEYTYDSGLTWPIIGDVNPFHVEVIGSRVTTACYADCDTSTGLGVLDIFDFLCFQNEFAAAAPYACDCDTSSGPGVCDIFDFLCFQNAFATGCP